MGYRNYVNEVNATVSGTTRLTPQEVLSIAGGIAGTKPARLLKSGPDKLILLKRGETSVTLAVQSIRRQNGLIFQVSARKTADGHGTTVLCKITSHLVVKSLGSRRVWGYYLYDHFMDNLVNRVLEADPDTMVEAEK